MIHRWNRVRAGSRSVKLANFLVPKRRSLQHQRKRVRNGLPDGRMCGERGNNFCRKHDSVPCGWSGQQVLAGEGRHPRPRHAPADTMYKPEERGLTQATEGRGQSARAKSRRSRAYREKRAPSRPQAPTRRRLRDHGRRTARSSSHQLYRSPRRGRPCGADGVKAGR